jgi:Domain of unknown function (DUF1771)
LRISLKDSGHDLFDTIFFFFSFLQSQQNEYYLSLRARATREGEAMAHAFEQSHAAYERKDGATAKELSNEGKAHQREMDRLNAEASAWIFRGEVSRCIRSPHFTYIFLLRFAFRFFLGAVCGLLWWWAHHVPHHLIRRK